MCVCVCVCVCIIESLCYTAEINTTLYSNYTSVFLKSDRFLGPKHNVMSL